MNRRSFIRGLGLLVAAPAVIRVAQLMPIKPWRPQLTEAEIVQAVNDILNDQMERMSMDGLAHYGRQARLVWFEEKHGDGPYQWTQCGFRAESVDIYA